MEQDMLPVFVEPQCLICSRSDGMLEMKTEVLDQIAQINKPLHIIAIVGLYRTGKSYLINRLAGSRNGFPLGSTIRAETKGIWVWCKPHPRNPDQILVLMDTEGLGDVEKGNKTHDCRIFVLASLLSSALVFNVKNVFDQDTLEKISFVTEMSKHVLVSNENCSRDAQSFDMYFPVFILTLRDFSLDLTVDGENITPDEYLENFCLKVLPNKDKTYNEPRLCIRKYFAKRKCFTFVCPARTKLLRKLSVLEDSDLDEDFMKELNRFTEFVFEECPPKRLENGRKVNGRMFAVLTHSYVDAIQRGKVPCIDDALSNMAQIENTRTAEQCVDTYVALMEASLKMPMDDIRSFSDIHHKCLEEAIDQFMTNAVYDRDHIFQRRTNERIQEEYEKFVRHNDDVSIRRSQEILVELSATLNEKTKKGEYHTPGGYQQYQEDLRKVLDMFEDMLGLGPKKQEVLLEFVKSKHEESKQILQADIMITQCEREAEEERHRAAQSEGASSLETRFALENELRREDKIRTVDENNILFYRQQIHDLEELLGLYKSILEHREKEYKVLCNLTESVYAEHIIKAKAEVEALKRDNNALRNQRDNGQSVVM